MVAYDTMWECKILTSLDLHWDHCDPVWRSGKILLRQTRGPGFNAQQVLIFSLPHLVCASFASASS